MTTTQPEEAVRRVLGVPVSLAGLTNPEARLRAFEPENPNLFVPRTVGIGWDLNIGAVAVRLGLLRPDDSVPDLVDHIPPATLKALRISPLAGAAAVVIAGAYTAQRYERLPTNWGLSFRPTRWGNGVAAMATPVLLSVGAGLWAEIATRRATTSNTRSTVDVTASAQALGLQAMSLVLITAAARQADNPDAARLLPLAGVITAPAVSTGVLVTTVRSALRRLDRRLRRNSTQQSR
ncbi:hypothetical protein GCM10023190_09250 [Enteractinococcus fodinae]|uniref:DUF5808 domain-containing protein n=1 Tax=Enteractinococcus fodinae TaxID=684663 RepID=A0ABU2B2J6_9MICC|nr:DUF5808 domain-containing protein [Enteractinococcus fodinae]MDR7346599.1 hypothetical protein [Enteractinococcus fodinae]